MAAQVDRFFRGKVDDVTRLAQLTKMLGITKDGFGWGLFGSTEAAFQDYIDLKRSQYVCWPFPGGRRNQPEWVIKNIETLEMLAEYNELIAKKPPPSTLPKVTQLFGGLMGRKKDSNG